MFECISSVKNGSGDVSGCGRTIQPNASRNALQIIRSSSRPANDHSGCRICSTSSHTADESINSPRCASARPRLTAATKRLGCQPTNKNLAGKFTGALALYNGHLRKLRLLLRCKVDFHALSLGTGGSRVNMSLVQKGSESQPPPGR